MTPIQDLLHRIRWDPEFGAAAFEVGYLDRVAGGVVRVPFADVRLESGNGLALETADSDGTVHTIPLHRVREVWRNGELIWQRPTAE
jgi:uncharacterized protein (UPF0248 family)